MDLSKFEFSIVYSLDVPKGVNLSEYMPPDFQKFKWVCTESGKSEYEYLEGRWHHGSRHRKYCSILNFEQFCNFLEHCGLRVEKCHTCGTLGAPGFGFGWAPAVSFIADNDNAIQGAYVTPIPPEVINPEPVLPGIPHDVRQLKWEGVEAEMWNWFEDGAWSARQKAEEINAVS